MFSISLKCCWFQYIHFQNSTVLKTKYKKDQSYTRQLKFWKPLSLFDECNVEQTYMGEYFHEAPSILQPVDSVIKICFKLAKICFKLTKGLYFILCLKCYMKLKILERRLNGDRSKCNRAHFGTLWLHCWKRVNAKQNIFSVCWM
jgi:hypothetical protein